MRKRNQVLTLSGKRNKLTAAVAMLLVSSILMVNTSYAWFTLSTAPEVTGITTSVGANGNLEMALLTNETYGDLTKISSAVGSSSATAAVTAANITWGNLVDLNDASYGLQNINLQPARLSFAEGDSTVLASITGPLMTPSYGKDGRVIAVDRPTYSTVSDESGAWTFVEGSQTYGVRAIGSNDNLTPQQAGLMAAKAAYGNELNSAKSALQASLSSNGSALAGAITSLAMGTDTAMTDEQVTAIGSMIMASNTALSHIDAAYKQVLLACIAAGESEESRYSYAVETVNEAANFADALAELQRVYENSFAAPDVLVTAADALELQQEAVATAIAEYNARNYTTALAALVDTNKVIINGFDASKSSDTDPTALRDAGGEIRQSALSSALINDGGAIVEMPDGSGVFAYVGSVAGNYAANCFVDIVYGTINLRGIKATMRTTATVNPALGTYVNGLSAVESSGSASTVLSDLYGYAMDFAFRTNAAESYLQLQTEGAQRVYAEGQSDATQGAGSTMTFKPTTNFAGLSSLTNDQIRGLMSAIRVAFVGGNGNVYGIAALDDITENSEGFTGKLYLQDYAVDANGTMTVSGKKTAGPDAETDPKDDPSTIMKLDQSVAAQLTVIVFLDGDSVDNADVANAAQSLTGSMNLQFSSSAELIPMQNTALQNMTITYTELTDDDYKAGLYEFDEVLYKVNAGYKIYQGSDNMVYFSTDETTYTKLTAMNRNAVLYPVFVLVDTTDEIELGDADLAFVATTDSGGTVSRVIWTSSDSDFAPIPADDDPNDAYVLINTDDYGGTTITATATLEFPVTGGTQSTVTKQVKGEITFSFSRAEYDHTVTYNAGMGSGTMDPDEFFEGETFVLPECRFTAPVGMWFKGWSTTIEGSNMITEVTETTTVYAIWEDDPATYVMTFDANGGSGSMEAVAVPAASGYQLPDSTFIPPAGYVFEGWAYGPEGTITPMRPGYPYSMMSDVTLYAVWEEGSVSYAVNMSENNDAWGRLSADKSSAAPGDLVTLFTTPANEHHLERLRITDGDGNSVPYTAQSPGKEYVFTMPASEVNVVAEFSEPL